MSYELFGGASSTGRAAMTCVPRSFNRRGSGGIHAELRRASLSPLRAFPLRFSALKTSGYELALPTTYRISTKLITPAYARRSVGQA